MILSELAQPWLTYIKIGAVVALLVIVGALWHHHSSTLETRGAQACVQTTTDAALKQTTDTNDTNLATADILSKAVSSYDQKIRDLASDRDGLAQRLHDAEAARAGRSSPMPNLAGTPGFVCRPADDGRPTARDRREAANLEACAANTLELISIRQAWADLAKAQAAR